MRSKFFCICILINFISCSKDNNTDPGSLKLIQVRISYNNTSDTYTQSFGYDTEGRMAKVNTFKGNATPVVLCTISYSGSEATLSFPEDRSVSGREIKYLLNGSNQPVSRIETNYFNNDKPGEFQRSLTIDTTLYTYDGSGRIQTEKYSVWDSTYFRPSYVWISVHTIKGSKQFSNTGSNAGSYSKTTRNSYITRYDNNTPFTGYDDRAEDVTFGYVNNWAYPEFGKNAFIYKDFNIFPLPVAHFSKYANYPDRFIQKIIEKDKNGVVTDTRNDDYSPKINFNDKGLISRVTFDSNPQQIVYYDFVYSK